MYNQIKEYLEAINEELVDFRRDLHTHPEQGWLEIRTTYKIYEELSKLNCQIILGEDFADSTFKMGLPDQEKFDNAYRYAIANDVPVEFADKVKDGNTGLLAVFKNGEGPTIGMRFDIDALPLYESESPNHFPTKNGFNSKNKGSMHACGHDGHATIGVGIAKTIDKFPEKFKGTIKIIFQPAEEGVRGAKSIVKKGHLDDVNYFLASHITTDEKHLNYDVIPGSVNALASTKLDVEFFGKSTHAAISPELGNNAMLGLANVIMNIYAIPRHSQGTSRVNVGLAEAGTGRNIIADYAKFLVETRGSTTEVNDYVRDYTFRIIENSAKMHNLEYKTFLAGETDSFNSDEELMNIVRKVASDISLKPTPNNTIDFEGSEDAAYMINKVQENGGQGTYMRILTAVQESAHNVGFDFDESVLNKAISIFIGTAHELMNNM